MENTKHGVKRLKQRTSFKKKDFDKIAEKALTDGYSEKKFFGDMRRFLDKVRTEKSGDRKGTRIRVFRNSIYIFRDGLFITTYSLPGNLCSNWKKYLKAV